MFYNLWITQKKLHKIDEIANTCIHEWDKTKIVTVRWSKFSILCKTLWCNNNKIISVKNNFKNCHWRYIYIYTIKSIVSELIIKASPVEIVQLQFYFRPFSESGTVFFWRVPKFCFALLWQSLNCMRRRSYRRQTPSVSCDTSKLRPNLPMMQMDL